MNVARRLMNTADVAVLARAQRGVPFWHPAKIARRQRRNVRAIVAHAYASVPYYAQTMRELRLEPRDVRSADDLSVLPLIDSGIVRADESRFVSSRVPLAGRRALETSGSHSGHRGAIWWDTRSLLHKLAYLERDRVVIGRLIGRAFGHRQLYLLPQDAQIFRLREWWNAWTIAPRRLATRVVEPAETAYDTIRDRIRSERPDIVYSYGSFGEHFARWLASRDERLDGVGVWCYGGDGMTAPARALLEERTGAMVYTTYQASETGRLGFECERRSGWHLNVDLCALRLIGSDEASVPAGTEGEVVVSNLHNRAMVLLNYRLGDRAILADAPCACGRGLPVLRELLGRRTEVVQLSDGREISGLVLEAMCMHAFRGTLRSQLVPEGPGEVRWRTVLAPGVDPDALAQRVQGAIRDSFGDTLTATIEPVADIPLTAQGKLLRVARADRTSTVAT
jgi:phenylacetate-CoA ligase